jgi:hypothetical protein
MKTLSPKQRQCRNNLFAWFASKDIVMPEPSIVLEDRAFYAREPLLEHVIKQIIGIEGVHWREPVCRFSVEITFLSEEIEVDVDYWNPEQGAGLAFLHFWCELVPNNLCGIKTDPFKVRKGFLKRGIYPVPVVDWGKEI